MGKRKVVILGSGLNEAMFEAAEKRLGRFGIVAIRAENRQRDDRVIASIYRLDQLATVYSQIGGRR
jgi:hypothetical protein